MRKILVIRLSSLGDIVLTVPVLKRLRASYPQAFIAMLVKEAYAELLREETSLNEIITFREKEPLLGLCQRIRKAGFDGVLDLHANFRSRLVTMFSGATRVARYRKAALARRLFVRWRWDSQSLKEHTLERYMDALHKLEGGSAVTLSAPPGQILIIQTAFLGDAVLTTPLLEALHEQFPQSGLVLLCTPEVKDVFTSCRALSEIILLDKRGKERSWFAKWRLIQQLRARHFDLAIIPHRSLTSALIAWLAVIPRRVGFSASQGRFLLTDVVPFRWGVHDVERNLALLKAFGVEHTGSDLWIKAEPEAAERVSKRLNESAVRPFDSLVGIHAGSVWATKRWLAEGFAAVADRLIEELGAKVVFVGGPKDGQIMERVLSMMHQKPLNWVGKTSLKELIAVIARCQAFLTNDSGPMHVAVAARVPTVAVFGPTTKELGFFPYGSGHIVIEKDLPCRPCSLHGAQRCPLGHFDCMKQITPEEVFQALKTQWSKALASPLTGPR